MFPTNDQYDDVSSRFTCGNYNQTMGWICKEYFANDCGRDCCAGGLGTENGDFLVSPKSDRIAVDTQRRIDSFIKITLKLVAVNDTYPLLSSV